MNSFNDAINYLTESGFSKEEIDQAIDKALAERREQTHLKIKRKKAEVAIEEYVRLLIPKEVKTDEECHELAIQLVNTIAIVKDLAMMEQKGLFKPKGNEPTEKSDEEKFKDFFNAIGVA